MRTHNLLKLIDDGRKDRTMKKIILAVTLLTLAIGFSTAQEGGSVKKVQVTKQTLAGQPAGEPYRIDLTRKGTVYEVAEGIDLSRVRVRSSTGEKSLSELARKSGGTGSFLLGTIDDLSAVDYGFPRGGGTVPPPGGGVTEVKCTKNSSGTTCSCVAGRDCRDLRDAWNNGTHCKGCTVSKCCKTCGTGGKRGCIYF